ncbi:hypothetical protein Zm00014a_029878 [Zea mays]|uniref:Uncharacterized protein n=1 Tax=Zea mays TaxID=4577 RepID=A0A3L6FJZ7_MAIZE|nr:hypothetical protein Zm00014a_029878 [Zea mays]
MKRSSWASEKKKKSLATTDNTRIS